MSVPGTCCGCGQVGASANRTNLASNRQSIALLSRNSARDFRVSRVNYVLEKIAPCPPVGQPPSLGTATNDSLRPDSHSPGKRVRGTKSSLPLLMESLKICGDNLT